MKRLRFVPAMAILVFFLAPSAGSVSAQEPRFTREDRERLIRLEAVLTTFMQQVDKRFEELRDDINKRFELIDKRFEQIDKRFEQIEKRFEQIDKRFEQVDKRIEQVEKRIDQVDKRIDQVDKRIDQVDNTIDRLVNVMIGIVATFGGIVAAVIGFALWDRRTMIRPFEKRIKPLEEDAEKLHLLLKALRKLAEKNQELADVLRSFTLL